MIALEPYANASAHTMANDQRCNALACPTLFGESIVKPVSEWLGMMCPSLV
jgi:hypothetical protein